MWYVKDTGPRVLSARCCLRPGKQRSVRLPDDDDDDNDEDDVLAPRHMQAVRSCGALSAVKWL